MPLLQLFHSQEIVTKRKMNYKKNRSVNKHVRDFSL